MQLPPFSKPFGKFFRPKKISIAIIGVPASGKSYLISDIIESFRSMGLQYFDLERDGIAYRSLGNYESDVMGNNGMLGTQLYACRPNNHYGAHITGGEKDFDIDFLNIPGEIFDQNRENLKAFFLIRNALRTKARKSFRLVTWKNDSDVEYIVEPIGIKAEDAEWIRASKESNIQEDSLARMGDYMEWPQIFAEINEFGRNLMPQKSEIISGQQLLDHITEYNVDSAMRSIAAILPLITPEIDKDDFIIRFAKPFYFLNFCSRATDIVICDKMFRPDGEPLAPGQLGFAPFLNTLDNFYTTADKVRPKVYLAYRGTDFLIKSKERVWKAFANSSAIGGLAPTKRRNIIYAVIAALIYHYYHPDYNPTPEEFNRHVGLNPDFKWGNGATPLVEYLTKRFLDFTPSGGDIMNGGTLLSLFRSHQGAALDNLMTRAYGKPHADSSPFSALKPHIYYTTTPVSDDLFVFSNDSESKNTRFVHPDIEGEARYFENYGSNLCLGTFQLCMDILAQHEVLENNEIGDIYYYIQQR